MATDPQIKLTEQQYLEIERSAEFRSEFLDGEMVAMSGASMEHAALQGNLYFELRTRLGGECRAFNSGLRVRVLSGFDAYPDVFVMCGEPRLADQEPDGVLNPVVIFEILSPSTEKYDRGLKFQHYRTIESLIEYVLVDPLQVRIEQFTRTATLWTFRDCQHLTEELVLDSIGIAIPLSRIYEGIEF
jgi:Uma2 family endonuclease